MNIFFYKEPKENYDFNIGEVQKTVYDEPRSVISKNLDENISYIKDVFSVGKNGDIIAREFEIFVNQVRYKAFLICVEGLASTTFVDEYILKPLMLINEIPSKSTLEERVEKRLLTHTQVKKGNNLYELILTVNIGNAVLFVDTLDCGFTLDVKTWEHRPIGNPENEAVIQGPHEGFNEVLRCNTALIRKNLNTPNLVMENIPVGNTTKTPGALCYLKNVANDTLVNEVRRRISSIDAQYILSSLDVEQYIEDKTYLPIPQVVTTERPDRVCRALTEGRVAFVLNGSSHVLIMPATFFDLITSAEDEYLRYPYSMLIRILRYLAVFLSLLFPAIFASLVNYHPELLLTNILLTVASSRALVPFGVITELILMEIAFELIKEAGIRVPGPIGSTLGIVGGLIIGQAAVEANLVSPIMVIVVALTGIASFTVPSYSLSFSFRFMRFVYVFAAMIAGLYGVCALLYLNIMVVAGTKSFGVAFLSPVSPAEKTNAFDLVFGSPIWKRGTKREDYLKPKDMYKKAKISRKWRHPNE